MSYAQKLQQMLYSKGKSNFKDEISLILFMSAPAVLAQISSVFMQYIDAAMVGRIGMTDAAAIGLVSSTIWLLGSVIHALQIGFSVLCSHAVGAKDNDRACAVFVQSLIFMFFLMIFMMGTCLLFYEELPYFLGGRGQICQKASDYFLIIVLGLPFFALSELATVMMQAHGQMKFPGMLSIIGCILDVIFNYIFIFPSSELTFLFIRLQVPGFNLGLTGAALGTVASQGVISLWFFIHILAKTDMLKTALSSVRADFKIIFEAARISYPVALQNALMMSAMIVSTKIVSPLGDLCIATNSFAITAESICFMAAYGLQGAACAIIGQAYGAKNRRLTINFAWISSYVGIIIMTVSGFIMFLIAPYLMAILTPDLQIQDLGARILRIEAFAEPLFGASIVIAGVLRGTGDTLVPGILNLLSIYGVRLPLAYLLSLYCGLTGVWIAMAAELSVRGILFILRLRGKAWLNELRYAKTGI